MFVFCECPRVLVRKDDEVVEMTPGGSDKVRSIATGSVGSSPHTNAVTLVHARRVIKCVPHKTI